VIANLEVEVAADCAGVAGLPDGADALAGPDPVAAAHHRATNQVGVEVAAVLTLAVDQQVVAVENRVVAAAENPPRRRGDEWRAAGGYDIEAFVDAAAAAGSAELADRAARPVRSLDREDMVMEPGRAISTGGPGGRRRDEGEEKNEGEEERVLQWCSITRSTMLYSFASSALMK